jgi:hypothetical protein
MLPIKRNVLFVGFALGVVYGLLAYVGFFQIGHLTRDPAIFSADLATIAFLGLVPMAIGAIPLLFTDVDQIKNYLNILFIPWASILGIFAVLFLTLREGTLCILVLGVPFLAAALIGTVVAVILRGRVISRKKRQAAGAALMMLPFVFVWGEKRWLVREEGVSVPSSVIVGAPATDVFEQLAVIEPIKDDEFQVGMLNRLGVPRPVEATVDFRGIGGHRVGRFERGLEFKELITTYDPPRAMTFDISVDPTQLEPKSTGRHALEGGYFRFVDATYTIEPLGPARCKVTLSSRYVARSSVNAYGELWANFIIGDFQERVLHVLARRFEHRWRSTHPVEIAATPP